ncbi:hypothetical protein D3C71_1822020 [compost metagenome]
MPNNEDRRHPMCLIRISLLACHLFGASSQMEHSGLEESGGDGFALERQFVQYRPSPCIDGGFRVGHARPCDELMERYHSQTGGAR